MGIQDRDYWNEWQLQKQGVTGYSARPLAPRNKPEPVVRGHADFSVAWILLFLFLAALCVAGYVLYRVFLR